MPRRTTKIKAWATIAAFLAMTALPSCGFGRKGPELPPNPVLGIGSRWAAVKDAYVRVKASPSSQSDDVAYLRRAEIVEVLAREMGKDCLPEEKGHWLGIKAGTGLGWVFSGYVEVYDSREKALLASRNMAP